MSVRRCDGMWPASEAPAAENFAHLSLGESGASDYPQDGGYAGDQRPQQPHHHQQPDQQQQMQQPETMHAGYQQHDGSCSNAGMGYNDMYGDAAASWGMAMPLEDDYGDGARR